MARRVRTATGLSQRSFAGLIGATHVTVARRERSEGDPKGTAGALLRHLETVPEACVRLLSEDKPNLNRRIGAPPQDENLPDLSIEEVRQRILEAHTRHAKGPTRTALIPELRREIPAVPHSTFDRSLRALDREGILTLGRAVDLAKLTPEIRAACLLNFEGTPLLYVSQGVRWETTRSRTKGA